MKRNQICAVAKTFVKTTSIRGPEYMFGSKHQIVWILLFLLVTSLCIWQTAINVLIYLSFHVKVSETQQIQSKLDFPSITFCPQFVFRRTVFSSLDIDIRVQLLTMFYIEDKNDRKKLQIENRRTCKGEFEHSDIFETFAKFHIPISLTGGTSESMIKLLSPLIGSGFENVLLKCLWKNTKLHCNDFFMNHLSDVGGCFTFNPGMDVVNYFDGLKGEVGMNVTNYNENLFIVDTPMAGLELVFNFSQGEYCGNDILKRGAGFYFQFHDKNVQTSFTLEPSIYLMPGYETTISVKPQLRRRYTESLGLCSNYVHLWIQPNAKLYRPTSCYMQCFTEMSIKTCKCYPIGLQQIQDTIAKNMATLGVNKSSVEPCFDDKVLCMRELQARLLGRNSWISLCPKCKPTCTETTYRYQMTHLRLSLDHLNNAQNLSITDRDEMKKNYAVIKINFDNLILEIVREVQAFTLKDLLIYFGGSICLFLGMSFLTIFEIAHFVAEISLIALNCCEKSATVNVAGEGEISNKLRRFVSRHTKLKLFHKSTKVSQQTIRTIEVQAFKTIVDHTVHVNRFVTTNRYRRNAHLPTIIAGDSVESDV